MKIKVLFLIMLYGALSISLALAGIICIILCFFAKNSVTLILSILFSFAFLISSFLYLKNIIKLKHRMHHEKSCTKTKNENLLNNPQETSFKNNTSTININNFNSTNSVENILKPTNNIPTTPQQSDAPLPNEEFTHLIQNDYKETLAAQKSSANPIFHRTAHEDDLEYNFITKYESELYVLIDKFETLQDSAYTTDNLTEKIILLKETINAFEEAKKFCYSKGKGGTIYFQDTYEHLHNSNNSNFSYIDQLKEYLEECIDEKEYIIPTIIGTLTNNNEILQKNIYKYLPDVPKSKIQKIIRKLEEEGTITRTPKSSTYLLTLNTKEN